MKSSLALIAIALCFATILFIFQPNNVVGPRAVPITINEKGFPYRALDAALTLAISQDATPQEDAPQEATTQAFASPAGLGEPRSKKGSAATRNSATTHGLSVTSTLTDRLIGRSVRYDILRAHPESLDRYLGLIAEVGPRATPHRFMGREQRLAYLLNAYTAGLLASLRDACPIERVSDPYWFNGLFWRVSLRVGGEDQSLNELGAQIRALAPGDPRIFLALSRGDLSSLAPRAEAWHPHFIEEGLQELESRVLHPPFVKREGDTLWLGALFKRYEAYFNPSPRRYVARRRPELLEGAKYVKFMKADETLRGQCEP